MHHLADSLRVMGQLNEAETLARQAVEIYRASADRSPSARSEHSHALSVLAQTLVDSGKPEVAILVRREFIDDCRRLWPADDGLLATALANLGALLSQHKQFSESESVLREVVAIRERTSGRESAAYASALASLGLSLLQQAEHAEAEPILRECLEIRKKALQPDFPDYWLLANARSMLGGALAGRGAALIESDATTAIARFTEAEPLLVESTGWLMENAESVPPERLRQALERIVSLYESWDTLAPDGGWGEQAAKWRAELKKFEEP
jgi:tetratricopeptide (TPR) repeat protein